MVGLKESEADFVERIPPMPAISSVDDSHEEEALVNRLEWDRGIRRAESLKNAFHATPSFPPP